MKPDSPKSESEFDIAVIGGGVVELAVLGTARMAMRGAGVGELPPLRALRAEITPDAPLGSELKKRFSEAVGRAKNWK